jgi:hypothetical protein
VLDGLAVVVAFDSAGSSPVARTRMKQLDGGKPEVFALAVASRGA